MSAASGSSARTTREYLNRLADANGWRRSDFGAAPWNRSTVWERGATEYVSVMWSRLNGITRVRVGDAPEYTGPRRAELVAGVLRRPEPKLDDDPAELDMLRIEGREG